MGRCKRCKLLDYHTQAFNLSVITHFILITFQFCRWFTGPSSWPKKKKNIIFPGSNTETDLRWSHHTPPGIPRMRSNWQGQPTKKNWSTSVRVLQLLVYETLSHCVYDLPLVRGVHLPVYSFEKNLGDNHRTRSCRPNVEATAPTHRSAHLRHCRTQSVLKRRLTPTAPDRSADKGRSDKDQKLPLMMNVNLGSL